MEKISKDSRISCLTNRESYCILRYRSIIDNHRFIIPYTQDVFNMIIHKLENNLPFTYQLANKSFTINSIGYLVKNNYIILQFERERK